VAVTQGFSKGLVNGIASSIALAATVASTVLSIKGALSGVGSFAKGTEMLTLKDGKPTKGGGMLIEAHAGERILTAKQNKEIGGLSNSEAVEMIKKGKQLTTYENMRTISTNTQHQSDSLSNVTGASAHKMQVDIDGLRSEMKTVNAQLQTTNKKLSNITNQVIIDENGITAINRKYEAREQQKRKAIR
jgi:hypothetical protein